MAKISGEVVAGGTTGGTTGAPGGGPAGGPGVVTPGGGPPGGLKGVLAAAADMWASVRFNWIGKLQHLMC